MGNTDSNQNWFLEGDLVYLTSTGVSFVTSPIWEGEMFKKMDNEKEGFPPIVNEMASTLILGTIPGEESLRMNQYYANSRNAFWKIMSNLFVMAENATYEERTTSLKQHQIALWDVIHTCKREGSLDSRIRQETIIENDFVSFFREYPNISRILFNGARAEKEYLKRVLPKLSGSTRYLKLVRLPSTSPAMARLSFDKKYYEWSEIIKLT